MMRNLSALVLIFITGSVLAGMPVSDPVSYTYYVEQLNVAADALKHASKQTETMGGVLTEAEKMRNNLEGSYGMVSGIFNDMHRIAKAEKLTDNVNGLFEPITPKSRSNHSKTMSMLGSVFNDPSKDTYNPWAYHDAQGHVRQASKKNAIVHSNELLASIKQRLDTLAELSDKIDRTENLKASSDLSNRLLAEIIKGNIEMLMILARMEEMMAFTGYKGVAVNDDGTKSPTTKKKGLREKMQEENGGMTADQAIEDLM